MDWLNQLMRKNFFIGEKIGMLTIVEKLGTTGIVRQWLCKCDCGKIKTLTSRNLRRGFTKSCGCINVLKRKTSGLIQIYRVYKSNAKKRNITFNLTRDEFNKLIIQNCYYCNAIPNNKSKVINYKEDGRKYFGKIYHYNGLDRINNIDGYNLSNVVPCCRFCNQTKMDFSLEEFKEHVTRIYNNFIIKSGKQCQSLN